MAWCANKYAKEKEEEEEEEEEEVTTTLVIYHGTLLASMGDYLPNDIFL